MYQTSTTSPSPCFKMAMQRTLEVFCGSWNMGNAMAEELEEFIPSKGGNFDILAIGLQESQYKVDASDKVADVDHAASSKDATTHTFQENMEKAFDPSIAHLTGKICAILGSDFYMVNHNFHPPTRTHPSLHPIPVSSYLPPHTFFYIL